MKHAKCLLMFLLLLSGGFTMASEQSEKSKRLAELLEQHPMDAGANQFHAKMDHVLQEWGGTSRLLYGKLSQDGFEKISRASTWADWDLIDSMMERDAVFANLCKRREELPVAELFMLLVKADGDVFWKQLERFQTLFDSLSNEDRLLLESEVFSMLSGKSTGFVQQPLPVEVARQMIIEFPETAVAYVDQKCREDNSGRHYEIVYRLQRSGSIISDSKNIRRIKGREICGTSESEE